MTSITKEVCQPPNSPNMDVLDLGFFNAIQSPQHKHAPRSIDELVHVVEEAYDSMSIQVLNKAFLSLQHCMVETMKVGGCNSYRVPHMSKDKLHKQNALHMHIL